MWIRARRTARATFFAAALSALLACAGGRPTPRPDAPAPPRPHTAATAPADLPPLAIAARAAPLRVDFVSVGQGDAILITSPTGKTVLVDGGPHHAGPALAAFVARRTAAPLDLVLLTHRHADHLGGLAAVIERQGARLFMDAPSPHDSPAYDALLGVLETRHIPAREARRGRSIDLGGQARLVLLGPPEPPIAGSRSDVNSNSVIARLEHGRVRILLMGDAEEPTERWLLASGADVRASVLKLAHHGSRYATSAAFLAAVAPRIAIASCGVNNEYGHPHEETLARLERAGVRVYRTDRDGTISIASDGETVRVEPAPAPAPPPPPRVARAGSSPGSRQ